MTDGIQKEMLEEMSPYSWLTTKGHSSGCSALYLRCSDVVYHSANMGRKDIRIGHAHTMRIIISTRFFVTVIGYLRAFTRMK